MALVLDGNYLVLRRLTITGIGRTALILKTVSASLILYRHVCIVSNTRCWRSICSQKSIFKMKPFSELANRYYMVQHSILTEIRQTKKPSRNVLENQEVLKPFFTLVFSFCPHFDIQFPLMVSSLHDEFIQSGNGELTRYKDLPKIQILVSIVAFLCSCLRLQMLFHSFACLKSNFYFSKMFHCLQKPSFCSL